jgi:AcrR family transcriptional regulator
MEKTGRLQLYLRGNDDRALLTELAGLIFSHYEENPAYSRLLLFSALERHELAALFFEQQIAQLFNVVARYFRRRMRSGAIRRVNPMVAARSFVGMVSYHGQLQLLSGAAPGMPRPKLINQLVDVFLDGLHI